MKETEEKKLEKTDLQDVLTLVREKLACDVEGGCGLFWADDDPPVCTRYGINEEDCY